MRGCWSCAQCKFCFPWSYCDHLTLPATNVCVTSTIVHSHQPRHAIWSLFDKVLVLGKGHELFYGSPTGAEEWFTSGLGLKCPSHTSPADFILDQANIDFDKSDLYDINPMSTVEDLRQVGGCRDLV